MVFPSDSSTTIKGDEIFAKDPGASVAFTFVSSSNTFASLSEGIITASIDNFNELYMLGSTDSPDPELLARDFKLSDQMFSLLSLILTPSWKAPEMLWKVFLLFSLFSWTKSFHTYLTLNSCHL